MPMRGDSGGAGGTGDSSVTMWREGPKAAAIADTPPEKRQPIYCSCCGTAILAERVEDAIVIKTRRNGRFHVAVVQFQERD